MGAPQYRTEEPALNGMEMELAGRVDVQHNANVETI
jgi:hypothetical protein